jgi:ribosomal protein S13
MAEPTSMIPRAAGLPTLTEVLELQAAARPPLQAHAGVGASTATELSAEVMFELSQRIDSLLEARLREALSPALARVAEGLIQEARLELGHVLKELVEEAVTRAIERHTGL